MAINGGRTTGKFFVGVIKVIIPTYLMVVGFGETVGTLTFCVGPSMIPTFKPEGTWAVVDKFSYRHCNKEYQENEVVIARCPTDPHKVICKRITGTAKQWKYGFDEYGRRRVYLIPEGHVWLAGDNPNNSTDSRNYGPVPAGLIIGRLICKIEWKNWLEIPFQSIPDKPQRQQQQHRRQQQQQQKRDKEKEEEEPANPEEEVSKETKEEDSSLSNDNLQSRIQIYDASGTAKQVEIKSVPSVDQTVNPSSPPEAKITAPAQTQPAKSPSTSEQDQ